MPQQFDVWIGEPLEDNAIPSPKRDQKISDVLANIDDTTMNKGEEDDFTISPSGQPQTAHTDMNFTVRELLTFNYGIIPMDGKDAFIAFAKRKMSCSDCGANPESSVSLMPKY